MDEITCRNCGSVITSQCMEEKKMEVMYTSKEKMINILSYVDFEKMCHVIKYFPVLNQKIGK